MKKFYTESYNRIEVLKKQNHFDLTVFISCFNEENYIIDTINTVVTVLNKLNYNFEIIIIDDCSNDNSVEIIKNYLEIHPELKILLIQQCCNEGLGNNFYEGAIIGSGKYYRLVCGDNVEPEETLFEIFSLLGKAEIIIPYHVKIFGKSLKRQYLSKLFTILCNFLSGHNIKYYNGLPLFNRIDILKHPTVTSGFGFQADILTSMLNSKKSYIQVPVSMIETKPSKALNLNNILSSLHVFVIIIIRRLSCYYHSVKNYE